MEVMPTAIGPDQKQLGMELVQNAEGVFVVMTDPRTGQGGPVALISDDRQLVLKTGADGLGGVATDADGYPKVENAVSDAVADTAIQVEEDDGRIEDISLVIIDMPTMLVIMAITENSVSSRLFAISKLTGMVILFANVNPKLGFKQTGTDGRLVPDKE